MAAANATKNWRQWFLDGTGFQDADRSAEAFIKAETEATRLYGDKYFGKGCLLARRLVERGVRMVTVNGGAGIAWDSHGRIRDHDV